MTNTVTPTFRSNRKSVGAAGIGLAAAVAAVSVVIAVLPGTSESRASRSDTESTEGVVTKSVFDIAPINNVEFSFDIDPGKTQSVTIPGANVGTGDANAQLGFAVTQFGIDDADPALTDTMVRVRDVSPAGDFGPTERAIDVTMPLGEFKDTAFISDRVISPGETLNLEVTMSTPFDVNGVAWSGEENRWTQTPIQFTVFGADIEDGAGTISDLSRGQVFDEAAGAYLRPAADVRAAIDTPVTPTFVAGIDAASWTDQPVVPGDAAYADGARFIRSFVDAYGRSLNETVYIDENGVLVGDGNADGNMNRYNADGTRAFG